MIAHTVARVDATNFLVVTGASLLEPTRRALPDLASSAFLAEPEARNTAPAIGIAAVVSRVRYGDEVVAVLPSDHYVRDTAGFRRALADACAVAADDWIVTLGIEPTHPETGYGYISYDRSTTIGANAHRIEAFVEKPDLPTAMEYVASERYAWNAGIFVFRPAAMLAEIERQMPALASGLAEIGDAVDTPAFDDVVARIFPTLPKTSIDFGVMEGAERAAVVPADIGWSDIGHWGSIEALQPADEHGNTTRGQTIALDSERCVVFNGTDAALTAIIGLDDIVVVHTEDAVLVVPRDRAQDVRQIVDEIRRRGLGFE